MTGETEITTGTTKTLKIQAAVFVKESIQKILREHLSKKEYSIWARSQGLSYPQSERYWKRSWQLINEKFKLEREQLVDKQLMNYWEIYNFALEKGDFNTARQILNDISKLQGLNEPEKIDITKTEKIVFKFGGDNIDDDNQDGE